MENVILDLFI